MSILTAKRKWARPADPKSRRELNRLLPVEEERVRRAMRVLHVRYGNWCRVADALGHHVTHSRSCRSIPAARAISAAARD